MPVAADFPDLRLASRPVPTETNPLGVKGGAETGTVGLPPAIVAAVVDALRRSAFATSIRRSHPSPYGRQ